MPKTRKVTRKIRRQRRADEESLYYILERDLDRGAIFHPHGGWFPQVRVDGKGIIDYALKYGDLLVGIEVKKGFPHLKHFDQVAKYSRYFDAVFLAYPSDAAAEALFLSETSKANLQVGVMALALYRTHLVRRAEVTKRASDDTWEDWFDETEYWEYWKKSRDIENFSLDKNQRLAASALRTKHFWAKVNEHGIRLKKAASINIPLSAWRFLAVVFALSKATSIYRMHTKTEVDDLFFKRMGWGYMNWGDALKTGLVYSREYGTRLTLYNLDENADALRPELEKTLEANLGQRDWKRINKLVNELRKKHLEAQKRRFEEFFKKLNTQTKEPLARAGKPK